MIIALIHWRIKPEKPAEFLDFWKTQATLQDRTGLVAEMLSEAQTPKDFPYATWSLDPESLGTFKSYVNVGVWDDDNAFQEQVGQYFNDDKPPLDFEKFRRRRAVLKPGSWRRGQAKLPETGSGADSDEAGRVFRFESGHPFRFESGHHSDLKAAGVGHPAGRWW
jgi:hypothetical protein